MQKHSDLIGDRPHLVSTDSLHTLRVVITAAFVLAIVFSVRGAFLVLTATMSGDEFWLTCIAISITIPEAILSMLPVMKLPGLTRFRRGLIVVGIICLFLCPRACP